MDMKKTAKKIAALVAGTTMLGATILSATALDLSNYPAPFVTNGVFSGKIVVGANAATSDVVGAIDLAASLQAAAKTTAEIKIPGATGTASVTGDNAEFKTGSDIVSLNGETLKEVKTTFTEDDLDALEAGIFDTSSGSTEVKQYLKFDTSNASVVYAQNDADEDEVLADFLYIPEDDAYIYEYRLDFTEGAESELDLRSGSIYDLVDFEGQTLDIIGAPYTIVDAYKSGSALTLSMLGGQIASVLRDGETKTYTIDGKDYEVTAVFISSDTTPKAKLQVNGQMTRELEAGKTQVLGNDVTIGVQSILTNQREGMVEFYLGASKLELGTDQFTNTSYRLAATAKVGTDSIDDAYIVMYATNTSEEITLNYIKFAVLGGDDYYVAAGKGLKETLGEDKEKMLTETWDIVYGGLMATGTSDLKFKSSSDHTYVLEYENINGLKQSFSLLTNKDSTLGLRYGTTTTDFIFTEPYWYDSATPTPSNANTFISKGDYFVVSDRVATDTKAATQVLRYTSIRTSENKVIFKDLAGNEIPRTYVGTPGTDAVGDLIVDGKSHIFYVGASSATDAQDSALAIDLNGDGSIGGGDEVALTIKGGVTFDLGTQVWVNTTGEQPTTMQNNTLALTVAAAKFDEAAYGPEVSTIFISQAADNEIDLDVTSYSSKVTDGTLISDPADDDSERAMSVFGVKFTKDSSGSIPVLTVEIPSVQRGAQVFLTAGEIEVAPGTIGTSGAVTSTTLNPIAVGLAVLDTDAPAIGSTKMIVVGGPCVNVKAMELMGNPTECTTGFTPGKAVIKLFADKNALLVAGYDAMDTQGACYVLSDYKKYALSGTEVEVVATDLKDLKVNAVQ